ncbi:LysR family transcriptional regulator [Trujillonella endophytica]|uniref:DNA-binding transcriptional regulator, LysR family n=1 Tax=Trujillonella endophytica TaxID=673521 RepID=A0A1H8SZH9_9ACTN|nr:LysR family transcriptional regulator [Trujillella endophytica]SEO83738.1 DNA-binding transcriptional regulator, LysR family [Trujillella endophytica]
MTFTQLRTFALVAELGSVRAAAAALGVSEPAVSAAVAALRGDLGDALFRRTGTGIELTAGGRALAVRARELVRLADRARAEVAAADSAPRLRVLATAACAEHVAGPVLAAFARRAPRTAVDLARAAAEHAAEALADRSADIVLAARPVSADGPVHAVPFLRYERIALAGPGHPLAGRGRPAPAELAAGPWLTGPDGFEPGSEEARWAGALPAALAVERHPSEAAARLAARDGGGVVLALAHAARDEVRRGDLVRLPVEGTPVTGLWWSVVPGDDRATPAARALQRFLTTPAATAALLARSPRAAPPRPTVRVELWS